VVELRPPGGEKKGMRDACTARMAASLIPRDETFQPMPVKKSAALYQRDHGAPPPLPMPVPMPAPIDGQARRVTRALSSVKSAMPYAPALAIVGGAAAIGILATKLSLAKSMQRAITFGAAGLATLGLTLWQLQRVLDESPDYLREGKVGDIEVRRYSPRVQAETTVPTDDFDAALQEGFRRLASYITGNNTPRRLSQRLSKKGDKPEKIAMTVPVIARRNVSGHRVCFVMPKKRARGDAMALPLPEDPRVTIQNLPAQRVAVMKFHGPYNAKTFHAKKEELLKRVIENGLIATGEPMFAGYDPPSTLPFLRRVEVWVPVV
jgi:hypothetical protein